MLTSQGRFLTRVGVLSEASPLVHYPWLGSTNSVGSGVSFFRYFPAPRTGRLVDSGVGPRQCQSNTTISLIWIFNNFLVPAGVSTLGSPWPRDWVVCGAPADTQDRTQHSWRPRDTIIAIAHLHLPTPLWRARLKTRHSEFNSSSGRSFTTHYSAIVDIRVIKRGLTLSLSRQIFQYT